MTPMEAADYWHEAFGAGAPYDDLTEEDVLRNLSHRGPDFVRCVRALEGTRATPRYTVLIACERRLHGART